MSLNLINFLSLRILTALTAKEAFSAWYKASPVTRYGLLSKSKLKSPFIILTLVGLDEIVYSALLFKLVFLKTFNASSKLLHPTTSGVFFLTIPAFSKAIFSIVSPKNSI